MGSEKKNVITVDDYIAWSFLMGNTILHFTGWRMIHSNLGDLSYLHETTIWKGESDILGERQEATRMPTRLVGTSFGWEVSWSDYLQGYESCVLESDLDQSLG